MALQPAVDLAEGARSLTAKMEKSVQESLVLLERVRHSMAHSKEMLARSREQMIEWEQGIILRRGPQDSL